MKRTRAVNLSIGDYGTQDATVEETRFGRIDVCRENRIGEKQPEWTIRDAMTVHLGGLSGVIANAAGSVHTVPFMDMERIQHHKRHVRCKQQRGEESILWTGKHAGAHF